MDTHAIQILAHYQKSDSDVNNDRFEAFIREVSELAKNHSIDFDEYESFRLPGDEYRIARCKRCGDLTIEKSDIDDSIEEMLPQFWSFIRRGHVSNGEALCEICERTKNVT